MNKPYVICHMVTSIDGKVTGEFLYRPDAEKATDVYYEINRNYKADAFACGRITMEGSFTGGFYPDLSPFEGITIPREDYIADKSATYFAVSYDRLGRLGWKTSRISDEDPGYDNAHVIEVLTEKVSDAYLAYLRSTGVSYIFAGKNELDISLSLTKLRSLFGIKTLLLEGGSIINGAFERESVIDELSLVVAPMIADKDSKPLFMDSTIESYALSAVKTFDGGVLWLNYKKT